MTGQPSDTPETDFLDANRTSFTDFGLYCNALDHARDLERRLAAAIRERDELREQLASADKRNEADTKLLIRTAKQCDKALEALSRYQEAVWWAIGLRGDFGPFEKPFGWRSELIRRCGLSGSDVNEEAMRTAAGMEETT